MSRKVNLFSTTGKIKNGALEGVTNGDDLRKKLAELKVDLSNKTMINAKTKETIDLANITELPEGDLRLFIMPAKTKSGEAA